MATDPRLPKKLKETSVSSETCESCHGVQSNGMHSDKSVEKVAADKCTDCHHENVYECFTCHA